jgi:hypothetical protein
MENRIIVLMLVAVAFVAGFVIGRKFPAHNYVRYENLLLFDTTTGNVCDPTPAPHSAWARCGQ